MPPKPFSAAFPVRAFLPVLLLSFLCSGQGALPPRHPSVLLDSQELATLRQELAKPGWKSSLYRANQGFSVMPAGQGVRSNAQLWLKRKVEIPAYGGHFHNFFCVDGDRLEVPKDQRFVPGPYRCPKCGKQYAGEKFEGALRRLAHGWLSQAALDLALVSALEQAPEYAAKSAEILLKYADAYPGPHTSTTAGGMIYQSLDEAMWVIPLAQAYDSNYPNLSVADRAKIETFLRAVALGIQACGTHGNWGSWHLSAVGVVGYAIGDQDLIGWATEKFKQQISEQLGDDGLWPESVHTYHYFPLQAFIFFAEAAWHAGVDLYHWEAKPGKCLLAMFSAPLAYAYPDLRLPAINDGWFQAFVPADFYELAYHRTRDPRFAWMLANGYKPGVIPAGVVASASRDTPRNGFFAFLFGKNIPAEVTPPSASSTNFPVLGICVLRSPGGAMMTFHYGPFLGHGHRDKMGITLFANQKLWLADYGTPGYGAAILPWYQSTLAHNALIVDGKNQAPTKENQVKLWLGDSDLEAAQSETLEAYPGVSHTRTVVRIGDYFVLSDRLASDQEHTYDLYLHGEGKLLSDGPEQKTKATESPNPFIANLFAHAPVAALSGQWAEGQAGVAFWVGGSAPLESKPKVAMGEMAPSTGRINAGEGGVSLFAGRIEPMLGECPAESGSRHVPLLISRQQGKTAEFITVLLPYQGRPDCSVHRQGRQIAITHDRSTDLLTLPSFGVRPTVLKQVRRN